MCEAAIEHAGDGRHVCHHEGDEVEGNDGVECDVRAEVDEGQDEGEEAGEGYGVGRDFERGVDACDPVGEGEAAVAGELLSRLVWC